MLSPEILNVAPHRGGWEAGQCIPVLIQFIHVVVAKFCHLGMHHKRVIIHVEVCRFSSKKKCAICGIFIVCFRPQVDIFAFIGSSKAADALIKNCPNPHKVMSMPSLVRLCRRHRPLWTT